MDFNQKNLLLFEQQMIIILATGPCNEWDFGAASNSNSLWMR